MGLVVPHSSFKRTRIIYFVLWLNIGVSATSQTINNTPSEATAALNGLFYSGELAGSYNTITALCRLRIETHTAVAGKEAPNQTNCPGLPFGKVPVKRSFDSKENLQEQQLPDHVLVITSY